MRPRTSSSSSTPTSAVPTGRPGTARSSMPWRATRAELGRQERAAGGGERHRGAASRQGRRALPQGPITCPKDGVLRRLRLLVVGRQVHRHAGVRRPSSASIRTSSSSLTSSATISGSRIRTRSDSTAGRTRAVLHEGDRARVQHLSGSGKTVGAEAACVDSLRAASSTATRRSTIPRTG